MTFSTFLFPNQPVQCQFGVGRKETDPGADSSDTGGGLNLLDPDLIEAMELFADLSPEEMEEMMEDVKQLIGDDPSTLEAIEEVKREIPKLKTIKQNLKDLVSREEVLPATDEALQMLTQLGDHTWDTIWNRQDDILKAVINSGQMNDEDIARFTNSPDEWEKELRFIWNELQNEAAKV